MAADEAGFVNRVYQERGEDVFSAWNLVEALAAHSPDERAFLALWLCTGEIVNGGFEQLIENSTGQIVGLATEGAAQLDLARHEAVLREVAALFPDGQVPVDDDVRRTIWERIHEEQGDTLEATLAELDEAWYVLEEELVRRLAVVARELARS
jgi:hypothetical protein